MSVVHVHVISKSLPFAQKVPLSFWKVILELASQCKTLQLTDQYLYQHVI